MISVFTRQPGRRSLAHALLQAVVEVSSRAGRQGDTSVCGCDRRGRRCGGAAAPARSPSRCEARRLELVAALLALAPNGLRALDASVPGTGSGAWQFRRKWASAGPTAGGDAHPTPDGLGGRGPDQRCGGRVEPAAPRRSFSWQRGDVGRAGDAAGRDAAAARYLGVGHGRRCGCRGIGSGTRSVLFPGHPGLRYAGFTTWRLLRGPVTGQFPMAESWGRGTVFGVMPLADGRVYCYAAAPRTPGARVGDELAELVGSRHVARVARGCSRLPAAGRAPPWAPRRPRAAFHGGRVAQLGDAPTLTPDRVQRAGQALKTPWPSPGGRGNGTGRGTNAAAIPPTSTAHQRGVPVHQRVP